MPSVGQPPNNNIHRMSGATYPNSLSLNAANSSEMQRSSLSPHPELVTPTQTKSRINPAALSKMSPPAVAPRWNTHATLSPTTQTKSTMSNGSALPSGKRSSLAGFDPFMASSSFSNLGHSTPVSQERNTAPLPAPTLTRRASATDLPPLPFASVSKNKNGGESKKSHRDTKTFCISDLTSISQKALLQEGLLSTGLTGEDRTPARSPNLTESGRVPPPDTPHASTPLTPLRGSQKTKIFDSKKAKSPVRDNIRASLTPLTNKLRWSKKGHRRTKSLEGTSDKDNAVKSSPPQIDRGNNPSMYPSVVSDLMALNVDQLQIPSLAKPSPTSFLTGKQEEVVRTSRLEAAPFQVELPTLRETLLAAKLNAFVGNYRKLDQNFDLGEIKGMNRMDLLQVQIKEHIPIAQSLIDCGQEVSVRGVVSEGSSPDDRIEVAVFEGQSEFIVVFRGTTELQSRPVNNKSKKKLVSLTEQSSIEVYQCFLEEYLKIERQCFDLLDKLIDEQPFCGVSFTGHSFGAALATLAAFRYASARPTVRASCLAFASPKVGSSFFRHSVNTQPNLKLVRVEYAQDAKCQLPLIGGEHAGHTIALHSSLGQTTVKSKKAVLAYKFDTPKYKMFKKTHPDLQGYIMALEEVQRLELEWATDFVGTGDGVVVNNEARQMI